MVAEAYGYVRVSSKEQNPQRQIDQMRAEGLDDRHIFIDRQSGKDFDRKAYNLLIGTESTVSLLRRGDLLIIQSLDRLGRNYSDIQNEWKRITKDIGADIRVLDMPLLNTTTLTESLDNLFVKDLVFQILCYVAEKERANIKARQKEGIEAAKRAGRTLGRPKAEYPENWDELYRDWQLGKVTAHQIMADTGIKKSTFYKLARLYDEENGLTRESKRWAK